VREGRVCADRLPATLAPPFRLPDGRRVTLPASADLTEYYEAFLAPTAHGDGDPTPLANGYALAVEVMENLRPADVVEATRKAFHFTDRGGPGFIEVTPGHARFPVPFFYPEMVELVAELVRNRFDVWIVSASNAWSVRWMVLEELNPRLREHGLKRGLRADHVVGITTLLADARGRLYKDALLVRDDPAYASLDERALRRLRLTSRLQFPVPTYSGKIACILDQIGAPPCLCAGDSPGDHAMLAFSRNRLWIARLEKPDYQRQLGELIRKTGKTGWLIQATLTKDSPGFVPDFASLSERLGPVPHGVSEAARILSNLG